MEVYLQRPALIGKTLIGPGRVTWPDGVDLPSTARMIEPDEEPEVIEEPKKGPDTLKGLQDKGKTV